MPLVGVLKQVGVEPRGILGLGLTHWWTELGSGMVVRDGFLYLALVCWWVRPVPDTVGCGFWVP